MSARLASVIGIALPRRLVSSVATRSNQSSSRSSRYRMAFGKSFGRAVRREDRPGTASGGLLDGEPSKLAVENRSGVWFLMGSRPMPTILPPALRIVRQLQIWRWEPSGIYIININASANLMPSRRSIPQNTILNSRQASPSSTPRRTSKSPARFVRRSPQADFRDCSTALCSIFCFSFQQLLAKTSRPFHFGDY